MIQASKESSNRVIPDDWAVGPLGPHVEINSGLSPSLFRFETTGTPYFKVDQLNNDAKYLKTTPYRIRGAKRIPSGSLIFPKRGASILLNKIRILESESFMDTNLMTLTVTSSIDSEYLYYALAAIELWRIADITSIPQINNKHINPLIIPFPPTVAEQKAIAVALSDADALIESLERLLAKKRDIKQGAMQELLTGKRRLPGFSGGWDTKPLGDLFEFSGGFTASRDQLTTDGHYYLHYGDIHMSTATLIDVSRDTQDIPRLKVPLSKVTPTSLLADGDVVFVDASEDDEGTSRHVVVANPARIPFISGLHTIVAKSKTRDLCHSYRRYCFQTMAIKDQFRFFAVGTKVSGISKTSIKKIALLFAPTSEQEAIASILSDMDAEIAALEAKLAKARQLKQGMMQELLTGRIRLV